jgi:hypothetical protein
MAAALPLSEAGTSQASSYSNEGGQVGASW